MKNSRNARSLGYIAPNLICRHNGQYRVHFAASRLARELALHFDRLYFCGRVVDGELEDVVGSLDAPNLEVIPQPSWFEIQDSMRHLPGIVRAYLETVRRSDLIFIRGLCPFVGLLYLLAFVFRRPICHWIIGDVVKVVRNSSRRGPLLDTLALLYAWQDRLASRLGSWLNRGVFLCNGRELACAYRSRRTVPVVSSTVEESDFFERSDTCAQAPARVLFVGYVRPEKGIEYLLEALSRLDPQTWELEIVGPDAFPEYRRRLDRLIAERGLAGRIHWAGALPSGEPVLQRMRAADLLVLPSLSEGTPHVLVEARASGLPCVASQVGGIPSMVEDSVDALLVPPRDPEALAEAIRRIIRDGNLRRNLIRNGLLRARTQTLAAFTALVLKELGFLCES